MVDNDFQRLQKMEDQPLTSGNRSFTKAVGFVHLIFRIRRVETCRKSYQEKISKYSCERSSKPSDSRQCCQFNPSTRKLQKAQGSV